MKIVIVGGRGTIGRRVAQHYSTDHNVIVAGRSEGDIQFDMTNGDSIVQLFEKITKIDALVCIAGEAKWGPFTELSESDYYIGIRSKLMGQVNLVRAGVKHLTDGGSFTLTTGILADDPVRMTASAAMVNGAIHSFVQATALELPRGLRINTVSSGLVEDAYEKYKNYFPGHSVIPMTSVINGYVRSIEGHHTGEIIRLYG